MLIYKTGDLLKAKENILCHQVNENGVMGGGLALQVASKYPNVEQKYKEFFQAFHDGSLSVLGQFQLVSIGDHKYISNCFSQKDFNTDYKALEQIFRSLLETCKLNNLTIAVPFKYGSGIANGNWKTVESILEKLSNEYGVDISVYKLEE